MKKNFLAASLVATSAWTFCATPLLMAQSIPWSHLTWATSSDSEGSDILNIKRSNPNAALGAPDVNIFTQNHIQQEFRFFSLRRTADLGASGTTFYFGQSKEDRILNKISRANENLPDIYLVEITWGKLWHLEGARVKLQNAVVADENGDLQIYPEYDVGVFFNTAALESRNANHPEVLKYKAQNTYEVIGGQKTITAFKFPQEVLEAESVKLVDYTDELNKNTLGNYINTSATPGNRYRPTPHPVTANWDGADLDAVGVHTAPSFNCQSDEGTFANVSRNKNVCRFDQIPIHLRGEFDIGYGLKISKGSWETRTSLWYSGISCLYQAMYFPGGGHDGPGTYTFSARKVDGSIYAFTADLHCTP